MQAERRGVGVGADDQLTAFSNPRAGGIIAMDVEEGDAVIAVQVSEGGNEIFIGTRNGMSIRFKETDVRFDGRTAPRVRGIELREDDEVVAMEVLEAGRNDPCRSPSRATASARSSRNIASSRGAASASSTSRPPTATARSSALRRSIDDDELMLITPAGQDPADGIEITIRTIGRAHAGADPGSSTSRARIAPSPSPDSLEQDVEAVAEPQPRASPSRRWSRRRPTSNGDAPTPRRRGAGVK